MNFNSILVKRLKFLDCSIGIFKGESLLKKKSAIWFLTTTEKNHFIWENMKVWNICQHRGSFRNNSHALKKRETCSNCERTLFLELMTYPIHSPSIYQAQPRSVHNKKRKNDDAVDSILIWRFLSDENIITI